MATDPVLSFRLRVRSGDVVAIGPGKVALLEAVALTGSITAAAKSQGMSYRRAWLLLDELNRSLRRPAIDSAKGGTSGGGSVLTDYGQALIELYRRIEAQALAANGAEVRALLKMLAR